LPVLSVRAVHPRRRFRWRTAIIENAEAARNLRCK
jgi:hypothetical protein